MLLSLCALSLISAKSARAVGSPLARNRWHVAYTLIRNPSLQELIGGNSKEEVETNCREDHRESRPRVFMDTDIAI